MLMSDDNDQKVLRKGAWDDEACWKYRKNETAIAGAAWCLCHIKLTLAPLGGGGQRAPCGFRK